MKTVIALGFGLQVLLGPGAVTGMSAIPVRVEVAQAAPVLAMTPLPQPEFAMSIMMTPLPEPAAPAEVLKEKDTGKSSLACAENEQNTLQAFGARSSCPTDRCITTQDDDSPLSETALAFAVPKVERTAHSLNAAATFSLSLPSSGLSPLSPGGSPSFVFLLATVVLRV